MQNINELFGKKLGASDGDIGHIEDFYFEDDTWAVRFVVAKTGPWLFGRLVLLAPHAFGPLNFDGHALHAQVTRKLIENAPSIKSNKPVSRQYEEEYYSYYGWPAYWKGGELEGTFENPDKSLRQSQQNSGHLGHNPRDDIHLRSVKALIGYRIRATDGEIGLVASFLVDEKTWKICELAFDTGHLFSRQEGFVPTGAIERISFEESKVYLNLSKSGLEKAIQHARGEHHAGHLKKT